MRFVTLSDWLAWLESCHPQAIDLGLDRIRAVAEKLFQQSPLRFANSKTVTIGGTNGKGSCVAFLDHILRASGYRVACYTSPHLLHYNERCVIDGKPVSDEQLIEAFAAVDSARETISLTYFEFGTLAALWLFAQAGVDVMLLEVGLGGRLDAVNIVDADVSIVASVDIDHQDWLGDNREQIAIEKAGIFRVNRPAISGDPNPPENLQKTAEEMSACWYGRGQQFDYRATAEDWNWSGIDHHGKAVQLSGLPLPQLSLDNAATVLQALQLLGLPVNEAAIRTGLVSAQVAGRFSRQFIQSAQNSSLKCEVIFDVAHNPAAARLLAQHLSAMGNAQNTIAVFAVMADKDFAGIVQPLLSSISHWYLLPLNDVPRALPASQAAMQLASYGAVGEVLENVADIQRVIEQMTASQRLIVFGSFYTVAAAMQWLNLESM
jgi:dihydrofolate synthase/folylpolyglutamate synthase